MNKILIIDDDRELCALIKRSVQAENIEADFCNTGKEGLQKLREHEYQLVVLDVMMPGMDGFETLEEIRKEYSLPILMFTSKNDSISKVRGLRAGADDYLTKPFDMDELIARIASLIRRYTACIHLRLVACIHVNVGICHIYFLGQAGKTFVIVHTKLWFAYFTGFGFHDYDSVGTTYTIYCSCGSVFQHCKRFDIFRVDIVETTFYPINEHKGTGTLSEQGR